METSNVPMRYDPESEAWVETTGKAYDQTAGAWEEKWSPKIYLFNDGDECTDLTGGWDKGTAYTWNNSHAMQNDGKSLYSGVLDEYKDANGASTVKAIDVTLYKKLNVIVSVKCSLITPTPYYGAVALFGVKPSNWQNTVYNQLLNKSLDYFIGSVQTIDKYLITIDISDINQNAYVFVSALTNGLNNTDAHPLEVWYHKIWLEK